MRKLFLQFYLTVVTSFLFSVLVVGAIYKNVVQNTTQRYLVDIFETSLYLIERELSDYPEAEWEDALNNIRSRIPLPVEIEPLDTFVLSPANQKALQEGSIIRLEDSNLFLQRIPHSDYLVAMGPVSYFHYVGTLQWIDVLAVLSLCLSLGIPTYLWIRPLWKHARELSQVSQKLGNGDFAARASLPEASALVDLGKTMNGMAGDIEELLASRKVMINAVSHDLRAPIARLRYRLEMLKGLSEDNPMTDKVIGQINRELDQLNDMTDELLLLGSLERQELDIHTQPVTLKPWLAEILGGFDWGEHPVVFHCDLAPTAQVLGDPYYLGRAVSNLLVNARRHAGGQVALTALWQDGQVILHIDDDGPGIPADSREQVLKPFTRLDASRNRKTGGYGLGLAIVTRIMHWHRGEVRIDEAPELGGARLTLSWPSPLTLPPAA